MRWGLAAACLVLTAALTTPAAATLRIYGDTGGRVGAYFARYMTIRQSGQQVIVDGRCYSACTMVLGLVPPERLCVTPNAVFGFHAAWQMDGAGQRQSVASANRALMQIYPAPIRAWVTRHGGLTARMLFLQGRELTGMVAPCALNQRSAYRPGALSPGPQALTPDRRPANADAQQ